MLTRNMAREVWARSGLQVGDLCASDLSELRGRIDREMRVSGLIRGSLRMEPRIRTRQEGGRLRTVEMRCRSDYFTARQAISFEESGFVGFAGWADEVNVQPVLTAFIAWTCERVKQPLPA